MGMERRSGHSKLVYNKARRTIDTVRTPEMASEDPAPYGDEKSPDEPDTVRPEWEDQRIRIEALRAAAMVMAPSWAMLIEADLKNEHSNSARLAAVDQAVIECAEKFAQWLETGKHDGT